MTLSLVHSWAATCISVAVMPCRALVLQAGEEASQLQAYSWTGFRTVIVTRAAGAYAFSDLQQGSMLSLGSAVLQMHGS